MQRDRQKRLRRLATAAAWVLVATSAPTAHAELGAYATLTTDYPFRGLTQTDGDPAIQLGVDYHHDVGWFIGAWGSTVEFDPQRREPDKPRDYEVNFYGGFEYAFSRDWTASASAVRYYYPDTSIDYDYWEVAAAAAYQQRWYLSVSYTDDWRGNDTSATAFELTLLQPLGKGFTAGGTFGYFDREDSAIDHYKYGDLGLSLQLGPVTLDARYYDTDNDAARTFRDKAGGRWVFSVSAGF